MYVPSGDASGARVNFNLGCAFVSHCLLVQIMQAAPLSAGSTHACDLQLHVELTLSQP